MRRVLYAFFPASEIPQSTTTVVLIVAASVAYYVVKIVPSVKAIYLVPITTGTDVVCTGLYYHNVIQFRVEPGGRALRLKLNISTI